MVIINHKKECVDFYTIGAFRSKVKKFFKADNVVFDELNQGVKVTKNGTERFYYWWQLAEKMEWFDDAEIVTDNNDKEKVMTWLNVA